MDKKELLKYIRDAMVCDGSPAEEVLVVNDIVCVRIDGELIGIELTPIEISLDKDKKTKVTKKKPTKKKSSEKKPTKSKSAPPKKE